MHQEQLVVVPNKVLAPLLAPQERRVVSRAGRVAQDVQDELGDSNRKAREGGAADGAQARGQGTAEEVGDDEVGFAIG